jgi:hypothetical protein
MSTRRFVGGFALLAGVRIAVVPLALASDGTEPSRYRTLPGDAIRYRTIAVSDGRPYRDFDVEYPPVMLVAIKAVDGGDVRSTMGPAHVVTARARPCDRSRRRMGLGTQGRHRVPRARAPVPPPSLPVSPPRPAVGRNPRRQARGTDSDECRERPTRVASRVASLARWSGRPRRLGADRGDRCVPRAHAPAVAPVPRLAAAVRRDRRRARRASRGAADVCRGRAERRLAGPPAGAR